MENEQDKIAPQDAPAPEQTVSGEVQEPEKSEEPKTDSNIQEIPVTNPQTPTGYCMKCRAKREMKDVTEGKMKHGQACWKGLCKTCGTKIFRIKPATNPKAPKIVKKAIKKAKEVVAKGKKLKKQIVAGTKATGKKLKLYVVTFWKGETQHVWAVKAASEDGAKALLKTAQEGATDLKNTAAYTLDDWIEALWRQWPARKRIARKLSAASRQLSWNSLSKKAKAIVRRNYLVTRINKWAANPPVEDWSDVEDEIANENDVDDEYNPALDATPNPPPMGEFLPPANQPYALPTQGPIPFDYGALIPQNPKENPASEHDFTTLLANINTANDRISRIQKEGSDGDKERLRQLLAFNTREWPRPNPPEETKDERFRVPPGYYIRRNPAPAEPADKCVKCGGEVLNTGKMAHNPKGGIPFSLLQCKDCGAKFKLSENTKS